MELCVGCTYCENEGNVSRCIKNHWNATDVNKVKLFNPMIFDCFDYNSKKKGSGLTDTFVLSVFKVI